MVEAGIVEIARVLMTGATRASKMICWGVVASGTIGATNR